jgi:hypothetical protein
MASSTIKRCAPYFKNIVCTYANYGQWATDIRGTKTKILHAVETNFLVSGDGTDYVRIYDLTNGTFTPLDTSLSPYTLRCIVCDI